MNLFITDFDGTLYTDDFTGNPKKIDDGVSSVSFGQYGYGLAQNKRLGHIRAFLFYSLLTLCFQLRTFSESCLQKSGFASVFIDCGGV